MSLYRGVLIIQGWNRGIPLYIHFRRLEFDCIQRCPHFRGLEYTVYRGAFISDCWNRGIPLYTEVSSFQVVGIEEFHCIQRCLHFRGVGIEEFHCIGIYNILIMLIDRGSIVLMILLF